MLVSSFYKFIVHPILSVVNRLLPRERNEWLRKLVNSCIREMEGIGMWKRRQPCAASPWMKGGRTYTFNPEIKLHKTLTREQEEGTRYVRWVWAEPDFESIFVVCMDGASRSEGGGALSSATWEPPHVRLAPVVDGCHVGALRVYGDALNTCICFWDLQGEREREREREREYIDVMGSKIS